MKLQTCTAGCNGDVNLRTRLRTESRNESRTQLPNDTRAPRRIGRRVIELAIVVALALGIVYAESWAIQQSPTLPGADNYAVTSDKSASTDGSAKTILCSLPIAVLH